MDLIKKQMSLKTIIYLKQKLEECPQDNWRKYFNQIRKDLIKNNKIKSLNVSQHTKDLILLKAKIHRIQLIIIYNLAERMIFKERIEKY